MFAADFLGEDFSVGVDGGDPAALGGGDFEVEVGDAVAEEVGDALGEGAGAVAGGGGDGDGVLKLVGEADGVVASAFDVGFVEDGEDGFFVGVELAQDGVDGGDLLVDAGLGGVDDVEEEVGFADFFEGGFEGFYIAGVSNLALCKLDGITHASVNHQHVDRNTPGRHAAFLAFFF